MICPKCKSEQKRDDTKYCWSCGQKISKFENNSNTWIVKFKATLTKFSSITITWIVIILLPIVIYKISNSSSQKKGNMAHHGGSATYRYDYVPELEDNPLTTNDESNDQPVGFYGTETMYVCNLSSGNCYDLDVDSDGENVERIYFPKGGWVDIEYSDCEDGECSAKDENGTEWTLSY